MKRSLETGGDEFERSIDRRIEGAIDRTLEVLGAAEPRAGFERRVLARLETAEVSALRRRGSVFVEFWRQPWRPVGVLSGCAAAALAVGMLLQHFNRAPIRPQAPSTIASAQEASATAAERREARRPRATEPAAPLAAAPPLRKLRNAKSVKAGPSDAPRFASPDEAAIDDLHASSHPAPPMPLTAQERLLLRMLHHGETVELAALDPAVLAAFDVEEGTDFHNFFEPPQDPRLTRLKETASATQP